MAAFVVLLVAVWGLGFMWVRGDLDPSADKVSASNADAKDKASPSASPQRVRDAQRAAQRRAQRQAEAKLKAMKAVKAEKKPVVVNPVEPRPKPRVLPPVAEFRMATFNVLGSSHTGPGGHHAWLASGPQRIGGVLALLNGHNISVVGIQEFQPNQRGSVPGARRRLVDVPGPVHGPPCR